MSVTKLDLYKTEWLDLVFANKNKQYGAYYLRQHYASNMMKALGITFLAVGAAIVGYTVINGFTVPASNRDIISYPDMEHVIILKDLKVTPDVLKPIKTKSPQPSPKADHAKTTVIPTKVVDDKPVADPPINDKLQGAISTVTTQGEDKGNNIEAGVNDTPGGSGKGTEGNSVEDKNVYDANGLTEMPEPVGGAQAWTKFLQRNLRYPPVAEDERISGRVMVSFIIEKDGSLSNIIVDRKAGFGFDEEAIRVLKKAAAWKPGMQNGKPVRVKYYIPINFRLPE